MNVQHLTPILNVSNLVDSFAWFEALGWNRDWDYGDPPGFGGVSNGEHDIFLCRDGQGSRGITGTWVYVRLTSPAEIDRVYARAEKMGLTVARPPEDMPWNSREVHIRHPDGHVFRIGASIETGG